MGEWNAEVQVEIDPRGEAVVTWTPIVAQPLHRIVCVSGDASAVRVRSLRHARLEYVDVPTRERPLPHHPTLGELVLPRGIVLVPHSYVEVKLENITEAVQKLVLRIDPVWTEVRAWQDAAGGGELLSDARWLMMRGEDPASLRALVEAVDAVAERAGLDPLKLDSRAKYVNKIGATLGEVDEEISRLETKVAELSDAPDPDEETKETAPLGGLSHEDAHFVLSGVRTAADALDAANAWPDDGRKWARYLRGLLK